MGRAPRSMFLVTVRQSETNAVGYYGVDALSRENAERIAELDAERQFPDGKWKVERGKTVWWEGATPDQKASAYFLVNK